MRPAALMTIETRHGPMLAFRSDRFITACLERYGEYAKEEWEVLAQLAKPGMTIVEVGANIGVHTIPLARRCAPGLLYAFEPQQRVFQALCANLANNGVENVVARADACGSATGEAVVPLVDYLTHPNPGGIALDDGDAPGQRVRIVTIDGMNLSACGLIKIDAEGFEGRVLQGAASTVERCRPVLYVENDRPDWQGEVIQLVSRMGYRLYWHLPAIAGDESLFGQRLISRNMLCIPGERGTKVAGLEEIRLADWG